MTQFISFMKYYYRDKKKQWLPRVRDGGLGMTIKEEHKGDFCGDGIVLYLDCSGGYRNLHMQ